MCSWFPLFYTRYVNDIFVVTQNKTYLTNFYHELNTLHPNLEFTLEISVYGKLPFLDIVVKQVLNGLEMTGLEKNGVRCDQARSNRVRSDQVRNDRVRYVWVRSDRVKNYSKPTVIIKVKLK